ncbi:MAG: NUDIX hydrolase [Sphingopyxis sp.]
MTDQPAPSMPVRIHLDDDDDDGLVPAIPAATLVVLHDQADGAPPELLMVRRAATMRFAPHAAVFPGGRVDGDDYVVAAHFAPHPANDAAESAARVAAIRETLEETGLPIGLNGRDGGALPAAALAEMRGALHAGALFSDLIAGHGARIDLDCLALFSRWRPNFAHVRVFDTRFYVAQLTGPRPELSVSVAENSQLFWSTARDAMDRADAGDLTVIFPTRRNLERLAQHTCFADVQRGMQQWPPRRIIPYIRDLNGESHLCIRNDCGYPIISEPVRTAL